MSLNCRPGDLARIIDDPETREAGVVDKIIELELLIICGGWPAWTYRGPRLICACPCRREMTAFADVLLRPIRGQDGDDETLAWAGKPSTVDQPVPA